MKPCFALVPKGGRNFQTHRSTFQSESERFHRQRNQKSWRNRNRKSLIENLSSKSETKTPLVIKIGNENATKTLNPNDKKQISILKQNLKRKRGGQKIFVCYVPLLALP